MQNVFVKVGKMGINYNIEIKIIYGDFEIIINDTIDFHYFKQICNNLYIMLDKSENSTIAIGTDDEPYYLFIAYINNKLSVTLYKCENEDIVGELTEELSNELINRLYEEVSKFYPYQAKRR